VHGNFSSSVLALHEFCLQFSNFFVISANPVSVQPDVTITSFNCILNAKEGNDMSIVKFFFTSLMLVTSLYASKEVGFHGQARQDEFVHIILYNLLGKQDIGYYLEIGAGEPVNINNTYVFEKHYGWKGLSIDLVDYKSRWYHERSNSLLLKDATQVNYSAVLQEFPQIIDYLSLDIDRHYDTVLRKVMDAKHIFKIITIEHDAYRYGDLYRNKEREILAAFGYHLLCADVSNQGNIYEDWWIYPDFFPSDLLHQLTILDLNGKDCMEVIKNIKTFLPKYKSFQKK